MLQQTYLPRQRGTDAFERVLAYRPNKRDDVLRGEIFDIGGHVDTQFSIRFSESRMDTLGTLNHGRMRKAS